MGTLNRSMTVAQIVLDHPACAQVFHAHRIDFCCRGEQTLATACEGKRLDVDAVLADLDRAIEARTEGADDPRMMSTQALIAMIVSRHHAYLRKALPFIDVLASKVARVHGDHEPKLHDLLETFHALRDAFEPHLDDEEQILFPALAETGDATAGSVAAELASMRAEHEKVGELLATIRAHANDYAVPEWACNSYRTLFRELSALELDTLRHVHLENHVLGPRFAAKTTAPAARDAGRGAALEG